MMNLYLVGLRIKFFMLVAADSVNGAVDVVNDATSENLSVSSYDVKLVASSSVYETATAIIREDIK